MDPAARGAYNAQLEAALADEEDGYTGQPLSKWMPAVNPAMAKNDDPAESRAVFVVRARARGGGGLGGVAGRVCVRGAARGGGVLGRG